MQSAPGERAAVTSLARTPTRACKPPLGQQCVITHPFAQASSGQVGGTGVAAGRSTHSHAGLGMNPGRPRVTLACIDDQVLTSPMACGAGHGMAMASALWVKLPTCVAPPTLPPRCLCGRGSLPVRDRTWQASGTSWEHHQELNPSRAHQELIKSSSRTHQELIKNSPRTHQELIKNATPSWGQHVCSAGRAVT